jgi:hypothetical protein
MNPFRPPSRYTHRCVQRLKTNIRRHPRIRIPTKAVIGMIKTIASGIYAEVPDDIAGVLAETVDRR